MDLGRHQIDPKMTLIIPLYALEMKYSHFWLLKLKDHVLFMGSSSVYV